MATETLTIRLDAADVREIARQDLAKVSDELQAAIALLRKAEIELPLQFENFRD